MKRIKFLFCALALLTSVPFFGQNEGLGCIYDPETDGKVPFQARLETRDYTILPRQHSIKQYCPTPKSQEQHGTCTSWATTYAARTICEAIQNNWTSTDSITNEAFAPIFIYKQASSPSDYDCQEGSAIATSLDLLKTKGAPKLSSFNVLCADYIPYELYLEAYNYRILGYTSLFRDYSTEYSDHKITSTKKALSQNHPVVIGMNCYKSFSVYGQDLWNGERDVYRGGHAMCVVGYDDDKYGGAFQIMNSWGTSWGDGGFIWVKYGDYCAITSYAYDVYTRKVPVPNPMPNPIPNPIPEPKKKYLMSGNMSIVERDGNNNMGLTLDRSGDIPHYVTTGSFLSGKKFRLSVGNDEPAWIYVIASDLQNNVTKLFPYADNISAYLSYKQCHLPIPDKSHEFELDTNAGTDYFCVLYSQEELDINLLVEQISSAEGTFYQKLKTVLGDKLAPQEDLDYNSYRMGFRAITDSPTVPLIVEIAHKEVEVNYK